MREIKFRAWDRETQRMYVVDALHAGGHAKPLAQAFLWVDDTIGGMWAEIADVVLMEYTGLKDKKGVEIYEGDVVRVFPDGLPEYVREVQFIQGLIMNGFNIAGSFKGVCEIIGNIYENKELLNENDESP